MRLVSSTVTVDSSPGTWTSVMIASSEPKMLQPVVSGASRGALFLPTSISTASAAIAVYSSIMGKTKDTQHVRDRHILTDATGRPTHVVLTIEAYERIADLVEEADDVVEVERRMRDADFLSLEEVKTSLGLHDPD